MKQEIKGNWLAALRSGEYTQGKAVLRRSDNTYCCLGVLCDLAVKAEAIPEPEESETLYRYGKDAKYAVLPPEVMLWAGLESDTGLYYGNSLAGMNDDGATFEQIALLIEEHF